MLRGLFRFVCWIQATMGLIATLVGVILLAADVPDYTWGEWFGALSWAALFTFLLTVTKKKEQPDG